MFQIVKQIWEQYKLTQTTLTLLRFLRQPQKPHEDGEANNLITFFALEALRGL